MSYFSQIQLMKFGLGTTSENPALFDSPTKFEAFKSERDTLERTRVESVVLLFDSPTKFEAFKSDAYILLGEIAEGLANQSVVLIDSDQRFNSLKLHAAHLNVSIEQEIYVSGDEGSCSFV